MTNGENFEKTINKSLQILKKKNFLNITNLSLNLNMTLWNQK